VSKTRVYIATTEGPAEIQRLEKEDPDVRSVICIRNTSEALPISPAYDAFIRKPTGVVERLYGHPVYRMDVSERITGGSSWQLGAIIAHALRAENRLAGKDDTPEQALWLTGEVDSELKIQPVEHITKKMINSSELFSELAKNEIPITIIMSTKNGGEIIQDQSHLPSVLTADSVTEVFNHLGLANSSAPKSTTIDNSPTTSTSNKIRTQTNYGKILTFSVIGIACLAIALWSTNNNEILTVTKQSKSEVVTRLIELRAPINSNCAAVRFGKIKPNEVEAVAVTPDQYHSTDIDTLCGIKLLLESTGSPIKAVLRTNLTEGDNYLSDDLSSRLIPKIQRGKTVLWHMLFSRGVRRNFHYQWNISLDGKNLITNKINGTHIGSM
jgi:hypothetical protein